MSLVPTSDEVFYFAGEQIITVDHELVGQLKQKAPETEGKRCRVCAHSGPDAKLHEMIITLDKETYIRPHRHLGKIESFHLIEGLVDIVFFDEQGELLKVYSMGDYPSGKAFYYRLEEPLFHTLLLHSDMLVFLETTNGPFRIEETQFAAWSPEAGEKEAAHAFQIQLRTRVEKFLAEEKSA